MRLLGATLATAIMAILWTAGLAIFYGVYKIMGETISDFWWGFLIGGAWLSIAETFVEEWKERTLERAFGRHV